VITGPFRADERRHVTGCRSDQRNSAAPTEDATPRALLDARSRASLTAFGPAESGHRGRPPSRT
jgi:hypothetical protein